MDFLRCYSADDLASFPAGTWGIREPGDLWEGQNRPSSEFCILNPKKNEDFSPNSFELYRWISGCNSVTRYSICFNFHLSCGCDIFLLLSLIFSSGVAFDRSLSRLGHGKGYYDRFISSYIASGRNKPLLGTFNLPCRRHRYVFWIYLFWEIVGLSLREQLQSTAVPIDGSDWKLDMLVTPNEVIGDVQ